MATDDKTELEAAVYRRLVEHLRSRTDVQNIDLMNLAGFCRNCLSNWMKDAADAKGVPMTKDQSREIVYGMPFDEWRAKHQKDAVAGAEGGLRKSKPKALTARLLPPCPVQSVDEGRALDRRAPALRNLPRAFIGGVPDGHSCRCQRRDKPPIVSPRISSRPSSSASNGSRKRRRRSPTISATSMPRPRATASTSRRCAPSCGCASRTSTSARSRRRSSRPICTRSACC